MRIFCILVSTAFSRKSQTNAILLRMTACWHVCDFAWLNSYDIGMEIVKLEILRLRRQCV